MKTIKKIGLTTALFGSGLIVLMGSYNSLVFNKSSFERNDLNVKFAKRIDELNGSIRIGRNAASISPFKVTHNMRQNNNVIEEPKEVIQEVSFKDSGIKKIEAQTEEVKVQEPLIKDLGRAELVSGLYNQNPLKDGQGYSGTISVSDGFVTLSDIVLPDGKTINISTYDRMSGNFFVYEDTETGEPRTGMIYDREVTAEDGKKYNHYVVTFAGDTNHTGTKLEFKSEAQAMDSVDNYDAQYANSYENLQNDDLVEFDESQFAQNNKEEYIEENFEQEVDGQEEFFQDEEFQNEFAQNEMIEEPAGYNF